MIVKSVACSFLSCAGKAAESASAADAPQIAVAPPERKPNRGLNPIALAITIETPIVSATITTTISTGCQPSAVTWLHAMRSPSSATPIRSKLRAANSMPGLVRSFSVRNAKAMPSSSAKSMTGAA